MVTRQVLRGLVVAAGVALVIEAASAQQEVIRDRVWVRGKEKSIDGKLVLTPAGLVVQAVGADGKVDASKKVTPVSFAEVVKFRPGDLPGVNRDDMNPALAIEDKDIKTRKDYEAARGLYAAMLKKAGSAAPVETRRHLEYRAAVMSTRMADESADDDRWAELADAALKEWGGFLTEYKSGWEVWPAAKAAARLQAELNKYDEAARMWGRLAKNPELPAELRVEAGVQEVDALFRSKAFSTAATTAETYAKVAAPGPVKDKLVIYERAAKAADGGGLNGETVKPAVEDIRKKIAESKDPGVRAVGFGAVGELYSAAGVPGEAKWEYLWVETVFNQDRDEALKAMCRLVDVWKALGDEDRSKSYREKIRRFRANF